MLTPVDIQQKKFHIGLGYEKKDVNAFFDLVVESYEQLYRSNAELREQVNTLTDGLQNYKSKEDNLKKSIMHAEKESEDKKSKAQKEAKSIELDAKNKAKNILSDAEARLEEITQKIAVLETQYAAYKSNFASLIKKQFEFLGETDFDVNAKIDDKALALLVGSMPQAPQGGGEAFGSFTGDPQMRDESTLGGFQGNTYSGASKEDLTSTSAVYTSNLAAGENFVDPFNASAEAQPGRYNPYDGRTVTKKKSTQTFTVSDPSLKTYKRAAATKNKASQASNTQNKKNTETTHSSSSADDKSKDAHREDSSPKKSSDSVEEIKEALNEAMNKKVDEIPTVSFDSAPSDEKTEESKSGTISQPEEKSKVQDTPQPEIASADDIEVDVKASNLIGDSDDENSENEDEYGFEFL